MSYLKIVDQILYKIKETEDNTSLITIDSIYQDGNSLFLIVNYQLISKDRNIKYNIFIDDITDNLSIDKKIFQLITEISIKNKIRLKV